MPPTVLMLLLWRKWFLVSVIVFTFPLSATALLIYAGRGTPLYNIFHLMTLAIWLYLIGKGVVSPASPLYWRRWAQRAKDCFATFEIETRKFSVACDAPAAADESLRFEGGR